MCNEPWEKYDAVVVMGKSHPPGQLPHELHARAAMGVLLWQHVQSQRSDAVPLICCEGYDLPDTDRSGAAIVRQVALQAGVPDAQAVARSLANCTAREVEAIRSTLQEYGRSRPVVTTHPYHTLRTRRYLHEVGVEARMVGCALALARQMSPDSADLLTMIEQGEPRGTITRYNTASEFALRMLHLLNPAGTIERYLADRLRGDGLNPQQTGSHAHRN